MANNLQDALLKSNLGNPSFVSKADEKLRTKVNQENSRFKGKVVAPSLLNLESIISVSEFKEVAKKLLLQDINNITDIVRIAHNIKEAEGGKKMIWLLLSLRDNLKKVKSDKYDQVIKRALRSTNPSVDIPPDWIK